MNEKLTYMKGWMVQIDPPKEANAVKKKRMAGRYSSLQI